MIWYFINLVFSWISIYRWNNFPKIEKITENDNIAFVLHTIYILKNILEEKEWINIDMYYIFKKIIFWSFTKFVISDIDFDVKRRIKNKNINIYNKLEEKIYSMLKSFDAPQRFKDDMLKIYSIERLNKQWEYQMENNLINFAKFWVSYQEAIFNWKVYEYDYKKVIEKIWWFLNAPEFEIFRKYIDIKWYENNTNIYLFNVRKLQFAYRWNKLKRLNQVSVMAHLFIVLFITYIIWIVEEKSDEEIYVMLEIALCHDISEAITWDIVTTTKKAVEWFDHLISEIEEEMIDQYLCKYLEWYKFKNKIKNIILNPWTQPNWNLVKISDLFSMLFESRIEFSNNSEFQKIYRDLKKMIQKHDLKSVNYLLKFWVDYFDDNMDEIIKKHFWIMQN